MKTSSVKTARMAHSKRGKPKASPMAHASMENLFGAEEEEMARLFNEELAKLKANEPSSPNPLSVKNDPTSIREKVRKTPKRRSTKSKSNTSSDTSDAALDRIISTSVNNKGEPSQNQNESQTINNSSFTVESASMATSAKRATNPIEPNVTRTIESPSLQSQEEDTDYTFELTNEEIDGISKQIVSQLSKDLSFDADDEFFVELADLEFGEDYPLEETPNDTAEVPSTTSQIKDRQYNKSEIEVDVFGQDESFELPDDYVSESSKELSHKEAEIAEHPIDTTSGESYTSQWENTKTSEEDESSETEKLEVLEDDKFDIDELINAGTNSFTPVPRVSENSTDNQIDTSCVEVDKPFSGQTSRGSASLENRPDAESNVHAFYSGSSQKESNFLPFGKPEMLQQILHAWAFAEPLELIQLGQEMSLEDEPFYSGDDDNFCSHHNSSRNKRTTLAEVIEHPLARYGLKVRTINAIELVGQENYYSLSEESRKELELMVQDLSKTEEGTARNTQLKQAIFGMFS